MYHYRIQYELNGKRWLSITATLTLKKPDSPVTIQFPIWRPGRYEAQHYTKNIKNFRAYDDKENPLPCEKITKSSWQITPKNTCVVILKFEFFCSDINAGSSYVQSNLLYLNPIQFCPYIKGEENQPAMLEVSIPEQWQVACALPKKENTFYAQSYHELVDSPLLASSCLTHYSISVDALIIHIWIYGPHNFSAEYFSEKFSPFIREQVRCMRNCPVKEYHFMLLLLTYPYYHGVEHLTSTVIVLGPAYDYCEGGKEEQELLSIASHEFFHIWNIKTIRPAEWLPYDYSEEKYSRLGVLAEGVTTYYGDYFLYRSGILSEEQYLLSMEKLLQRHFWNHARTHMPVTEASIDTWLDGYQKGTPHRKTSIYVEGALLTFILDTLIYKETQGQHSFEDVLRTFYAIAQKNKGIDYETFRNTIVSYQPSLLKEIFVQYIEKPNDLYPLLLTCFESKGWDLQILPNNNPAKRKLGILYEYSSQKCIVTNVYPGSPAYQQGITENDTILSINHILIDNNFEQWFQFFYQKKQTMQLEIIDDKQIKKILTFSPNHLQSDYFHLYKLTKR